MRLHTNFEVCISIRFRDTLGCTPKFMGVTWPRLRPFSRFFFAGFWDIATMRLCTKFQVSNSTRFRDTLRCTPKFMGVTWHRPRPFSRFFLASFEDIATMCLHTNFEVSISTLFGDKLPITSLVFVYNVTIDISVVFSFSLCYNLYHVCLFIQPSSCHFLIINWIELNWIS